MNNQEEFFNCIRTGQLDTVIQFLRSDPSLANSRSEDGYTPTRTAIEFGQYDILTILNQQSN